MSVTVGRTKRSASEMSASHSTSSLYTPRLSVEASINSDMQGIKKCLFDLCLKGKLFAKIQHTTVGITKVTIQGHPKLLPPFLEYLKEFLAIQFDGAAIVWSEAKIVGEDRLTSVTIEETLPGGLGLKRNQSSGEFMEKQFEEISFGGSAATENVKSIVKETFNMMTSAATGFGVAKGWIPSTKKEHISIQYKDERFDLEVSTITSLPALVQAVSEKFNTPIPMKSIYRLDNGVVVVVSDVKDLKEGMLYFALNVNESIEDKSQKKVFILYII